MRLEKYGTRYWAVYDEDGRLVVVCLYKKGGAEVIRRLTEPQAATHRDAALHTT